MYQQASWTKIYIFDNLILFHKWFYIQKNCYKVEITGVVLFQKRKTNLDKEKAEYNHVCGNQRSDKWKHIFKNSSDSE